MTRFFLRLWPQANPDYDGMLCVGCLEARLGRRLTPSDFTGVPLNEQPFPAVASAAWSTARRARSLAGSASLPRPCRPIPHPSPCDRLHDKRPDAPPQ